MDLHSTFALVAWPDVLADVRPAMLSTVAGTLVTFMATLYALAALLCRLPNVVHPVHAARPARGSLAPGAIDTPATVQATAPATARSTLPVSVLKPLCGDEPRLEHNLATFCTQTHPCYQIVFGVRDPGDPAIAVVRRLIRRCPACDIALVVDGRMHGANRKVGNLINMSAAARHPWLMLADSDVAVAPDSLARVTAPLADPTVGIVTCPYRATAVGGAWSRVGALFVDTWFAPSVRVASRIARFVSGPDAAHAFGFGATIALRADTLRAIGGFTALKDRLADDYWLGELTRRRGLRTVLSDVNVSTDVAETGLAALWARERRWLQTIRALNPVGYAMSWVTFTLPILALGLCLAPTRANLACAALGAAARLGLHLRRPAPGAPRPGYPAYAPLRDILLLAEWCSAFFGHSTVWRRHRLAIDGRTPGPSVRATRFSGQESRRQTP
jgi:ceramide glucosyltransferase